MHPSTTKKILNFGNRKRFPSLLPATCRAQPPLEAGNVLDCCSGVWGKEAFAWDSDLALPSTLSQECAGRLFRLSSSLSVSTSRPAAISLAVLWDALEPQGNKQHFLPCPKPTNLRVLPGVGNPQSGQSVGQSLEA